MIARGLIVAMLFAGLVSAGGQEAAREQAVPPLAVHADGGTPEKPMSDKQKKLFEDTERLVKMAAELKASVDKSSKNELSLDVVRKAEAVELLAKSVKDRMRTER